jgi:hypothetical protein
MKMKKRIKIIRNELAHIGAVICGFVLFMQVCPIWTAWIVAITLISIDNSWRRYNEKITLQLSMGDKMSVVMETTLGDAHRIDKAWRKGTNENISTE